MRHPHEVAVLVLLLGSLVACSWGDESDGAVSGCDGATVTVRGTDGDDQLVGTDGPDVVDAGDGDDVVQGLGGDDVLCGGDGADRLVGGPGDDRLLGEEDSRVAEDTDFYRWYGDTLVGGPGDDLLDGGTDERHDPDEAGDTVVFSYAPTGVTVDLAAGTASGHGTDTILGQVRRVEGSPFDDRLVGSAGDDVLSGRDGADVLIGREGDDVLDAALSGADATDTAQHTLDGGPGRDLLLGARGDDELRGGPGSDEIQGDAGVDLIRAGAGNDNIIDRLDDVPGQVIDGGPGQRDAAYDFPFFVGGSYAEDATGVIDLETGYLRGTVDGVAFDVVLRGVEDVQPQQGDWTVVGGPPPGQGFAG